MYVILFRLLDFFLPLACYSIREVIVLFQGGIKIIELNSNTWLLIEMHSSDVKYNISNIVPYCLKLMSSGSLLVMMKYPYEELFLFLLVFYSSFVSRELTAQR